MPFGGVGGGGAAAVVQVVMRAGFPMMNPKVAPADRTMDHSRLFGNNLQRGHPRPPSADPQLDRLLSPSDLSRVSADSSASAGSLGGSSMSSLPSMGSLEHPGIGRSVPAAAAAKGGYGRGMVAEERSWPPPPVARLGAMPHSAHSAAAAGGDSGPLRSASAGELAI